MEFGILENMLRDLMLDYIYSLVVLLKSSQPAVFDEAICNGSCLQLILLIWYCVRCRDTFYIFKW